MRGKIICILIVLMAIAFGGYLLRVAFVGDPLDDLAQVEDLRLAQEGTDVAAYWNEMDCDGYEVRYFIDGRLTIIPYVKDNTYKVKGVYPGHNCKVTVSAHLKSGMPSLKAKASMTAGKVRQNIKVEDTAFYGFEGNDFRLKAEANGPLHFRSSDKTIVKVSSEGLLTFGESGEAQIIITADGNGLFEEARREISVFVYPPVLDKITGTAVENLSGSRAVIRWKPDEYAAAYKVFRKNVATGEYEEVAERPAETTYLEVTRDDYDYGVKGLAEVNGDKVDGRLSDPVEVRGTTEEAPAYTSYKKIGTLNKKNMDLVATIYGCEGSRVPQTLSIIGDDYVVAYVNMKSTKGNLISYSRKDGTQKIISPANGIRHANGCAYDPNRNRLYVLSTMSGKDSKKCYVFDAESKKLINKINMPVSATAMEYDVSTDKFYLGKDKKLYVCDSNFKLEKTIDKGVRHFNQDMGAYNGAMLVCKWHNPDKTKSDIDIYRVSDGAYIGSYDVSIGEIESCAIDDGHLVILMNTIGSADDKIYRTKERIPIP